MCLRNEIYLSLDTTFTREERLRTTICIYSHGGDSKAIQANFSETRAHGRENGCNDDMECVERYHDLFFVRKIWGWI